MWTILSLGTLLALSLASCSNSLSEPDIQGVQEPAAPCEAPKYRPWSGTWFSSRVMSSTTGCPPVSPSQ